MLGWVSEVENVVDGVTKVEGLEAETWLVEESDEELVRGTNKGVDWEEILASWNTKKQIKKL